MTNSYASPRIVQALKYLKNREAGRLPSETDLVDGWEKAAGLAAGIAGVMLRLPTPRFGPAAATSLQFEQTLRTDLVVEMKRLDMLLPTPAIAALFFPYAPRCARQSQSADQSWTALTRLPFLHRLPGLGFGV
jgi:hypothetical protein